MDDLDKKLIEWIKDYFHERLLIHVSDEESDEEEPGKNGAILFKVKLKYIRGYRETWLLNEGGETGHDRVLTGMQYQEFDRKNQERGFYDPIYVHVDVNVRDERDGMVVWSFDGGEVVGGTCGAGYEGEIIFDRAKQAFAWGCPLMQTWIA
jgi:hypothetical protein